MKTYLQFLTTKRHNIVGNVIALSGFISVSLCCLNKEYWLSVGGIGILISGILNELICLICDENDELASVLLGCIGILFAIAPKLGSIF